MKFTHPFLPALLLFFSFAPTLAFAQAIQTVQNFYSFALGMINGVIVPIIFALAFLYFLYGVFRYFIQEGAAGNPEKRQEGTQFVAWSMFGFFVMFSLWGLVNLLVNTFGFGGAQMPNIPTFNGGTGSTYATTPNINNPGSPTIATPNGPILNGANATPGYSSGGSTLQNPNGNPYNGSGSNGSNGTGYGGTQASGRNLGGSNSNPFGTLLTDVFSGGGGTSNTASQVPPCPSNVGSIADVGTSQCDAGNGKYITFSQDNNGNLVGTYDNVGPGGNGHYGTITSNPDGGVTTVPGDGSQQTGDTCLNNQNSCEQGICDDRTQTCQLGNDNGSYACGDGTYAQSAGECANVNTPSTDTSAMNPYNDPSNTDTQYACGDGTYAPSAGECSNVNNASNDSSAANPDCYDAANDIYTC
jgi:hypothetical protein